MSEFCFEKAMDCKRAGKNINDQQLEFMHRYLNVCEKVTDADLKNELWKFCFNRIHSFIQFVTAMEILKDRVDDLERMEMGYIIDDFVREYFSMQLMYDNQDADATGAEDPETIGAAEAVKDTAARVNELESRQYDDEMNCNKYSAAEIAQKLNVLSQYCDIDLSGKCDIDALVHFLESVELDTEGNVWLIVQVDEHTFKRFRMNREAAGQITM